LKPLNEKGFAFITVVIFSVGLFVMALSYFDLLISETKLIRSTQNHAGALALAEAGVEEVMWEYNYSSGDFQGGEGWSGASTKTKTVSAFTDTTGSNIGSYVLSVANWNTTSPLITVTATVAGGGTGTQVTLKAKMKPRPLINSAVKAKNTIYFTGYDYTDSYNSTNGAYGRGNIFRNGDVVTNSSAVPAITLNLNAAIKGDANTGAGGTVSNPSKVTGSVSSTADENISAVIVPPALVALPSLGKMATTTTLNAGSYKYTDISLGSNQYLIVNGNVTIYLTGINSLTISNPNAYVGINPGASLTVYAEGNISIGGSAFFSSGGGTQTSVVTINGTSTCTGVSFISAAGSLFGLINAPSALVNMTSDGPFYGAIITNEFQASGSGGIHYDENLANKGPSNGLKLSWIRQV